MEIGDLLSRTLMDLFFKSGAFGLIILVSFLLHSLFGALFVLVTRSRRVAILFTLAALFPLVVGVFGSCVHGLLVDNQMLLQQALAKNHNKPLLNELIMIGKQEAMIPTYLGAGATIILIGLGVCGIVMTKDNAEECG